MEFLLGNQKEFDNFLESITSEDKVGILTHDDLDGIASAVLLNQILIKKEKKLKLLYFLNYSKNIFDSITKKVKEKEITKLFIADFAAENVDLEGFEKLKKDIPVLLIDHHPINPKLKNKNNIIKTKSYDCSTVTIYNLGKKILDQSKWYWLVCATIIAEFSFNNPENLKLIQKFYPEVTLNNIYKSKSKKISDEITSALIYYNKNKRKVFEFISNNKMNEIKKTNNIIQKEIDKIVEDFKKNAEFFKDINLYFYHTNPKFNISSIVSSIVSLDFKDKTIIILSDMENGKYIKISSRNQCGKVDLNELLKKSINNFEDATAGGHVRASGGKIMKKDMQKFKDNILKNLSSP